VIVLYHASGSAHSASVRITLAEKGLEWTGHSLDLSSFEQHEPEFLRINRSGLVPVLEDDGRRLTETFFILLYLNEAYPKPPLGGGDPRARYQVHKWGKYVETHIAPHLGIVRWATLGGPVAPDHSSSFARLPHERRALWERAADGFSTDQVAASRATLLAAADRLAGDLAEGEWLAGAAFTLADIAVFPHVRQFAALGIPLPQSVQDWCDRFSQRDSAAAPSDEVELLPVLGPEPGRWG
jgi:glutathione S-transferase